MDNDPCLSYGLVRSMYFNSEKKLIKCRFMLKKSSYHLCKNNASAAFDFLFLSLHYFMVIFDTSGSFRPLKTIFCFVSMYKRVSKVFCMWICFEKNNLNSVHDFHLIAWKYFSPFFELDFPLQSISCITTSF